MNLAATLREATMAVPAVAKLRVGAGLALAYAILPIDLIPDRIPVLGRVDDAAVAVLALTRLVEAAGADIVREHWDGSPAALDAVLGALAVAGRFVPRRLRLAASVVSR
jgi:uncharacterized membrane protein YkvA (DUF1232 family)